MAHSEAIRQEATVWAVRTGDPRFDDWDGFTEWLEEDPAHAAAYDEVAAAVADAAVELAAMDRQDAGGSQADWHDLGSRHAGPRAADSAAADRPDADAAAATSAPPAPLGPSRFGADAAAGSDAAAPLGRARAGEDRAAAQAPRSPPRAAAPRAGNDDEPASFAAPPRRRFLAGAMAAAAAVLAGIGAWQMSGGPTIIETAPGEVRIVQLEGGGSIAVAGESRLVLDADQPRLASLDYGRALFTIRHDPSVPFTLDVGEDRLVDVGTVFDVALTPERMTVSVAEGAVVFNPDAAAVRIEPGQVLTSSTGSDLFEVASIPLAEVGEWQEGRLTFREATLAEIAADLSRATGTSFTVSPRAAERRVSGSLLLDRVEADPRAVGPLLGVTVRYDAGAWELGTP